MELVTKESVYSVIDAYYVRQKEENERACACIDIWSAIKALPAADVAPVRHGKWIKYTISDLFEATCSECHVDVEQRYPNCPYCRAIMDAD